MKLKKLPDGPYKPNETELEILKYWLENKLYKPETARKIFFEQGRADVLKGTEKKFSIINPPPNAYARPHIGNVSGYAYQDVFARRARMQGMNVAMIPGKDHAAQQAEIVYIRDVLTPKGQKKEHFTREEFYDKAYDYFTQIMSIAQEDEKRVGLSADFDRDIFTLDPRAHATVMRTFSKMWEDEMVYKGVRIVNWSPGLNSAVADIDTERQTVKSTFYYIKYAFTKDDAEILAARDKYKKSKFSLKGFDLIDVNEGKEQVSKADKKSAEKYLHMKVGKQFVWFDKDALDEVEEKDYEVNGMIIPYSGDVQLVIGEKDDAFENYIFHKANEIYGSSFARWFEDDKKLSGKDLDYIYRRGFILGTVRPETKFGDTAFAVNPEDKRFKSIQYKDLVLESLNGEVKIKVITDPGVDVNFGTGMVKVTPAHAPVDYKMYLTHNAEHPDDPIGYKNVIEKDGTLNHIAGKAKGMHAEKDREKIADMFEKAGYLVYTEESESNITICERTKTVIQPIMSSQWFIDTDKLKVPALKAIENGDVTIHPENMTKKLKFWLENLWDWPISRSIWWGYRIPVWYKGELKEFTDINGQVAVEIGGVKVEDMKDAIEKGLMRVDIQEGFAPILIPGKHGFASSSIFKNIKLKFPWAKIATVKNIDAPAYKDYKKGLEKIKFNEDSVVIAHSIGAPAVLDFLVEKKIKIKKLILLAPSTPKSTNFKGWVEKGFWEQKDSYKDLLGKQIDEVILIHSDNDETQDQKGFDELVDLIGEDVKRHIEKNAMHFAGPNYVNEPKELTKIVDKEAKDFVKKETEGWVQDEDVFDTWFSSGQWPFATLESEGLMDFYPTLVMETGFDILELWVSRMLMLGLYTQDDVPFKDVYLHGLIKGPDGQKMSKSKGNLVYPDEIIKEYGADTLRMMYIVGNKAGASYKVDYEKIKGYRNFLNKIWNASRFVITHLADTTPEAEAKFLEVFEKLETFELKENITPLSVLQTESKINAERIIAEQTEQFKGKNISNIEGLNLVDNMMLSSLQELSKSINNHMDSFRIGLAAEELYQHFWHIFADIYIEQVKGDLFQSDREGNEINRDPVSQERRATALAVLTNSLQSYYIMLHPYIPFITEHLWQYLPEQVCKSESIMYSLWIK